MHWDGLSFSTMGWKYPFFILGLGMACRKAKIVVWYVYANVKI